MLPASAIKCQSDILPDLTPNLTLGHRVYRPICPSDEDELRALHLALFPINYEPLFYTRTTRGYDDIFGWVAIERWAPSCAPVLTSCTPPRTTPCANPGPALCLRGSACNCMALPLESVV